MSDNSTAPPSNGGDSNGATEFILAVAALVISIVALFIALLQALNQYFGSATGYTSCSTKVIGQWGKFTTRRMRWDQFRFEVLFEAPVIFVSNESNTRGPLGGDAEKKITYLNGTSESYSASLTYSQEEFNQLQKHARGTDTRQTIHTADNELATWVSLLMAIQRMEQESRDWQNNNFFNYTPPQQDKTLHTLTVGLQKKRRSWDTMPDTLKKPYCTTTISHMVEITAMLGIYWKEFDRTSNTYRAQGNGFSLVGSGVDDLGIAFNLQKTGPTWFQENRVVPNNTCKELCFGLCPTLFRDANSKTAQYADEPKDQGTLQLGSLAEIAETLAVFGCNTNTVNFFRPEAGVKARHSHLFPIPFEMLGMVGVVVQIENTAFTMLPNPTVFGWDKSSFSLRLLVHDFAHVLTEGQQVDPLLKSNVRLKAIHDFAHSLERQFLGQSAATGKADGAEAAPAPRKSMGEKPDLPEIMSVLHAAIRDCDSYLVGDADIAPLVQHVFRAHLQEVLKVLNHSADDEAAVDVKKDGEDDPPTLESLDAASPVVRHVLFVNMYVSWVRQRVVKTVCEELRAQEAQVERGTIVGTPALADLVASEDAEQQVSDIWCTLVFRMLCWLLLHDFHKKDIQISKSEVFGSRLPVYIL